MHGKSGHYGTVKPRFTLNPDLLGSLPSSNTANLQAFSEQQNPDLPGSPIYWGNFLSPTTPVNRGLPVYSIAMTPSRIVQ